MYITLTRFKQDDYQTLGTLRVIENSRNIFTCKTLELPWKDNEKRISRIPKGSYPTIKHISPKFGKSLWIQEVPNRSEILIHYGNYAGSKNPKTGTPDTLGCILCGEQFVDIDGDNHLDITNSRFTIEELYNIVQEEQPIEIIERWSK